MIRKPFQSIERYSPRMRLSKPDVYGTLVSVPTATSARYRSILWCNRFLFLLVIYWRLLSESQSVRISEGEVIIKRLTFLLIAVAAVASVRAFSITDSFPLRKTTTPLAVIRSKTTEMESGMKQAEKESRRHFLKLSSMLGLAGGRV